MNSYLYNLLRGAIAVSFATVFLACEEDEEVNDAVPDFPTAIGISNNSLPDIVTEGETATLIIGVFSDRDNDQAITVDWTTTGAVELSGQATIEAGTKVDTVLVAIPENAVANDTAAVTFSLSNVSPSDISFVPEGGRESVTFAVVDDTKVFNVAADTLAALESDGVISIPIEVSGNLDEDVQIAYTVSGTAVEGVDYEFIAPSPATIGMDDEEPSVNIRLLNNADLQAVRTLEINVTEVISDNEEVVLSEGAGSVVYNLSDDSKEIVFERLDVAAPIAEDTLVISSPGTYEVFVGVNGDLLGEATVEVNSDDLPTGVMPLVMNPFTLVPGEDARPYSFTVSAEALDGLTEDLFFSFALENVNALNDDSEVVVSEDASQVLVQLVAPE